MAEAETAMAGCCRVGPRDGAGPRRRQQRAHGDCGSGLHLHKPVPGAQSMRFSPQNYRKSSCQLTEIDYTSLHSSDGLTY